MDCCPRSKQPRPLVGMGDYLPTWRQRRPVKEVPREYLELLPPVMRRGLLSQVKMSIMTGVNERHYRAFENNGGKGFSSALVQDVVNILGLNEDQASALYEWTQHEAPRKPPEECVAQSFRDFLYALPFASYISGPEYDIRAYNKLAGELFPWMTEPGANMMAYALGEGTGSKKMLLDWADSWAKPMISQLRLARVRHPENRRLREVIAIVRRNPEVRELWDQDGDMRAHAYGDIRPMNLPALSPDPVKIQILSFHPMNRDDLRLVVAFPVTGDGCPLHPAALEVPERPQQGAPGVDGDSGRGLPAA